ncbi:MAG: UDP-N-acetylmuramoyl-tripeptide--D-alanyl-D-alanine ligase [Clostridiales bacterium]|nr:UDP-N-acetylmuramoyl-tripeptide--D-alanyl-D-alanine ligase [Clostridiales bacterium]
MIWTILLIISFSLAIATHSLHQTHMFQLNTYKPKVQVKWLFTNRRRLITQSVGVLLLTAWILLHLPSGVIAAAVIFLITAYLSSKKSYKKPLVYTSRVIRLLTTLGILLVGAVAATIILREENVALALILPGFYIFAPILVLLSNLINQPIEKAIRQWYINDAKKILAGMPRLTVIGVTGSYGKTSVKFFLSKLLSCEYNVLHTPESYNTPMGIVKTIRNEMKAFHEIFICEMGAKNVGDIAEICDIVKPKHGVITAIGPQHLESFHSIENILKTKFELADAVGGNGFLFLNYDNEYIRTKKEYPNIVSYGIKPEYDMDYLAYDIQVSSAGTRFKMKDENKREYEFTTKLIGTHNVENVAAAIAVANKLGIPMEKLVMQVKQIKPVPHRLQLIKRNDLLIIDDAYNSNPSGAKAALDTLSMFEGVKIMMTPGMIELGSRQYECNKTFGIQASKVCDYVVLVGEEQTKPIYDGLMEAGFSKECIRVVSDLQDGFSFVDHINAGGQEKILLLENDLPDNY